MSTPRTFTFPGLWPYIELAAEGRVLPFLGRGRGLWHYKQVQDSLGQLPGLDVNARRELLAHVASVRNSLAATLDGIDLAVRESMRALGDPAEDATVPLIAAEPTESTPHHAAVPKRRRG
jgi:hypothetical protein